MGLLSVIRPIAAAALGSAAWSELMQDVRHAEQPSQNAAASARSYEAAIVHIYLQLSVERVRNDLARGHQLRCSYVYAGWL